MSPAPNNPANINLHIERVVLDRGAFTNAQLARLQSSMEQELATLLRGRGLSTKDRTEGRIVGAVTSVSAQSPGDLGRTLARSVYESLNPLAKRSREGGQ